MAGYSSCVGMLDRGSGVASYVGVLVESSYWHAVGGSSVWAATALRPFHSIGGGSQLIADKFADIEPDPIYTHY